MQQDEQHNQQWQGQAMHPAEFVPSSHNSFSEQNQDEQQDDRDVAWQPTLVVKRVKKHAHSQKPLSENKDTPPHSLKTAKETRSARHSQARSQPRTPLHASTHNTPSNDEEDSQGPTQRLPPSGASQGLQKPDPLQRSRMRLREDYSLADEAFPEEIPGDEAFPEEALDISSLRTRHLMQLSGMMRTVRPGQTHPGEDSTQPGQDEVEEYWPNGIKQTGPLPVVNLYGKEPFGRTKPEIPVVNAPSEQQEETGTQPKWKEFLAKPIVKVTLGLIVGIAMLLLVTRIVDIPTTIGVLQKNLTTPAGITFALCSGVAFLGAFSVRGVRWKLFLNPVGNVSVLKAIQLFLVGIFLNFLLPIRGGEVAKSLMLKRIADIPISKSLPTVAMDKALDLMPALFIMALVPLFGVQMDIKLWLVLGTVGGLLLGLIFFVALAAWKRNRAISLLHRMTRLLPKKIGNKVEGFATGFVDALLAGASQPKIFIPAVLLTVVAVLLDGLFAMLAFWTIGEPISFGTAIFGYTVYNMFYILPTPPGQVGSNEVIGLLVFFGLLHINEHNVTAMFIFSHPWAALLMCVSGMACLSALGLTISSAMKVQSGGEEERTPPLAQPEPAHA
jgi:uncharacterized protein (TIRG00374 family)